MKISKFSKTQSWYPLQNVTLMEHISKAVIFILSLSSTDSLNYLMFSISLELMGYFIYWAYCTVDSDSSVGWGG